MHRSSRSCGYDQKLVLAVRNVSERKSQIGPIIICMIRRLSHHVGQHHQHRHHSYERTDCMFGVACVLLVLQEDWRCRVVRLRVSDGIITRDSNSVPLFVSRKKRQMKKEAAQLDQAIFFCCWIVASRRPWCNPSSLGQVGWSYDSGQCMLLLLVTITPI